MGATPSRSAKGLAFVNTLVVCALAHPPVMPSYSIVAGGAAIGAVNAISLESTVSIETSPSIVPHRWFPRPSVPFGPPLPPPRVFSNPVPSTTGATDVSVGTKTIFITTTVSTEAATSQDLQSASSIITDPNSALLPSSGSWIRTLQRSGAVSKSIESTRAPSTGASSQESSTIPTALNILSIEPSSSQSAAFTILPTGMSPSDESSILIGTPSTLAPGTVAVQLGTSPVEPITTLLSYRSILTFNGDAMSTP